MAHATRANSSPLFMWFGSRGSRMSPAHGAHESSEFAQSRVEKHVFREAVVVNVPGSCIHGLRREGQVHEIERQFLCRQPTDPVLSGADAVRPIRQAYLTGTGTAVRVRRIDDTTVLTVKSGIGLVRREVEFPIDADGDTLDNP